MKRIKILLTLITISGVSFLYSANENFRITYQGIFKINDVPYSGTKGFIFKIRNGSGGAIQWESQCQDITISSGIFRAVLGETDGVGTWSGIDFNAIDAYLEVTVGDPFTCTGMVSIGAQERLLASPYSILASKTSSVPFSVTSSKLAVDRESIYKVSGGSVSVDSQGVVHVATTTNVLTGNINVAGGKIQENGSDLLPAGTVMFYDGASCPSGWSEYTAARGRFLAGVPSGGTIGGTAGGAILTNQANPYSHTHDVNVSATTAGGGEPESGGAGACCCGPDASRTGGSHSVDPPNTTSGAAQGGIPYVQALLCRKN